MGLFARATTDERGYRVSNDLNLSTPGPRLGDLAREIWKGDTFNEYEHITLGEALDRPPFSRLAFWIMNHRVCNKDTPCCVCRVGRVSSIKIQSHEYRCKGTQIYEHIADKRKREKQK